MADKSAMLLEDATAFSYAGFSSVLDSSKIWGYRDTKPIKIQNSTRKSKNIRNESETSDQLVGAAAGG